MSSGRSTASLGSGALASGGVAGVGAYLVGYLATIVLVGDRTRDILLTPPTWKGAAWYFYNAHFVDLRWTVRTDEGVESDPSSLIAAGDEAVLDVLYVVPAVALLLAGWMLYRQLGPVDGPVDAAVSGAAVVVGYLPLALLGALVTEHTATAEVIFVDVTVTAGPKLVPALVLAGVVYPVVFGAIGGAVGRVLETG